jgi:hypothetical protein
MGIARTSGRNFIQAEAEAYASGTTTVHISTCSQTTAGPPTALIRFDAVLLSRVDRAARKRRISSAEWLAAAVSRMLDEEEQA